MESLQISTGECVAIGGDVNKLPIMVIESGYLRKIGGDTSSK